MNMRIKFAGMTFQNPFVLASGILGVSASLLKRVETAGAGAVTTKTVTRKPRSGYRNPVVVELEYGLLNAIGLSNPGVEEFSKEVAEAKKILSIPLIASVTGSSGGEMVELATAMEAAGADAVELNLSCPHVKGHGLELGHDPGVVREVVSAVKSMVKIPVLVKLSPSLPSLVPIAEKAVEAGADGVVAVNTIRAMAIDVDFRRPVLTSVYGGLSGPALHPIAVRCVYEVYEALGDVPIIGVGGVITWRDAVELMLAGARAVGVGTGIMYRGLEIFRELRKGLEAYMEKYGFTTPEELVGAAHK
mgnify:CR=1 FL=1